MTARIQNLFATPKTLDTRENVTLSDLRTPVSALTPTCGQFEDQLKVYQATINPLKTSLDLLQNNLQNLQLEPSDETQKAVDSIRAQMRSYKATHQDIQILEKSLEAAIHSKVEELMRTLVDQGIESHIDRSVKAQVAKRLKAHGFTKQTVSKIKDSNESLKRLQVELHNTESKRLNGLFIKGEDDDEPLNTLMKPDGTVSPHFPKTFKDLYTLTPSAAKALLQEYEAQISPGNDHRMVNRFIYFVGASYQVVL